VAIGNQAEFERRRDRAEHGRQRPLGDVHLGLAGDLTPHRARRVENHDRLIGAGGLKSRGEKEKADDDAQDGGHGGLLVERSPVWWPGSMASASRHHRSFKN
jgi:hypothetical protein